MNRCLRVHPWIETQITVGDIDLGQHGSGIGIECARETDDLACKCAPGRVDFHEHISAELNVGHVAFRHGHAKPEQVALGHLYHRKCIRIVVLSCLNQRTGIGVALCHHSRKRGDDLLVSGHRFEPAAGRARNPELLLHGIQRGLRDADLGRGLLVFGACVIQLLLCDQPWSFFGSFFQTGVFSVQRGVRRLRADDLALCASDIRLTVADLGLSALHLILQLWDFQQSQDFALTNAVAYIDFDPADIS